MPYKKLKYWFDEELALSLGQKIGAVDPSFDASAFQAAVMKDLEPLELKARVEKFADELFRALGQNFQSATEVLLQILGPENEKDTGMFKEYYWIMPIAKLVEKYGLDHFEQSMRAIAEITKRNTGEYAIRPFIEADPEASLGQMKLWSLESNFHLRRLASEGGRPRLPWAPKLDRFIQDPRPLLPLLNNLKDDPSKYVQKSVGNCINDILNDHLEIGKSLIEEWSIPPVSPERQWIIKHALRNLRKAGDPWALAMV